jgi:trigger factor
MRVEVENLDKTKRKIDVFLDEDSVSRLREGILEELKRTTKIKGFRPGKVPRSIIQTYYKELIGEELKKKILSETFSDALKEAKVAPIGEPDIHFREEAGAVGYAIECEVVPEFEVPPYKGLDLEIEKKDVKEGEVAQRIESVQQMHAELIDRDGEARKGDFIVIGFAGFLDGKPLKDAHSERYPMELGTGRTLPEFESHLIGMRAGDEKEIDVDFAEDYPDKDVAGKKVHFTIALKEIKEKKLPEINEDFAKDLGFETKEAMEEGILKEIEKEKEVQKKNEIGDKILEGLLEKCDIPVPEKLMRKRLEGMIEEAKSRMGMPQLGTEETREMEGTLRKQFEPEAEKRIKTSMLLFKIAEAEGIKVEESEVDDRLRRIAEETKKAYDYIRDFYDKYDLKGGLRSSMREEKTVDFLITHAAIKEKE